MAGTRFYKAEAADGRFVDNNELAEALEPYARKTDLSGYVQDADLSGYAKKTDIPDVSTYATKDALAAKADVSAIPDVSGLATKAEVTSGLAAKADASALSGYQPKGDYATVSQVDQKVAAAQVGGQVDLSPYATKDELATKADVSAIPDVSGLETAEHAEETYQPVGDYALKSDIPTGTVLVLDAAAEVPEGTPADTLIVRRSA